MTLRRIAIFLLVITSTYSVEGSEPCAVSILGAPASGKGYIQGVLGKISTSRLKFCFKETLSISVDGLRDDLLKAPEIILVHDYLESFQAIGSRAKNGDPLYQKWIKDHKESVESIFSPLITKHAPDLSVSVTDNELVLGHSKDGSSFEPIQIHHFLGLLGDRSKMVMGEILGDRWLTYNFLKRTVRYLQANELENSSLSGKNIMIDETGDKPETLFTLFKKIKRRKYVNLVVVIHPPSILINFMQNAERMVKGFDGGRDSSQAISESYKDLDMNLPQYIAATEDKGVRIFNYPEKLEGTNTNFAEFIDSATTKDDNLKRNSGRLIDRLVILGNYDLNNTYDRITKSFTEKDQRLFNSILLLHRDNPRKGGSLPSSSKEKLLEFPIPLNVAEAKVEIREAVDSGRLARSVLMEAEAVWH